MSEKMAPLGERWSSVDLAIVGSVVAFMMVVGPAAIALTGDPLLGAYAAGSAWFVALGYEIGLYPQLKWQLQQRRETDNER